MMLNKRLLFALAAIVLLTACSDKTENPGRAGIDPKPGVAAPHEIDDSFAVQKSGTTDLATDDKAQIILKKSALEKEFLFQSSIISQTTIPMGSSLRSRVVAFRFKNDRLFLMEATKGHTVSNDIPQNLMLTEFPVLAADADTITFDFNKGTATLFVMGDWYSQDFDGGGFYNSNAAFEAVNVSLSYIESATMDADRLLIRQIAQIPYSDSDGNTILDPTEVRYALSPYTPDSTYTPAPSLLSLERMGFFEVAPQLNIDNGGHSVIFSARFHPAKPIVFAVSSNTPAEYLQAVKDGILYWNKVFGRDIVQVIDGPANVSAPDYNHNVVQWLPWEDGGFAYADAQLDPRSGQVTRAHVYFASSFGSGTKAGLRALLRRLKSGKLKMPADVQPALHGFEVNRLCNFTMNEMDADSLERFLAADPDAAAVQKAAQDSIRETIAHEIGHTLGLRHNFAGSLAVNFPLSKRGEFTEFYIKNLEAPAGVVGSSSVMEYANFAESLFIGDQMSRGIAALEYDKKAIATLYDGKTFKNQEIPLFCTDRTPGPFVDCEAFDTGNSEVEYVLWDIEKSLEGVAFNVLENYIWSKIVIPGLPVESIEQVIPGSPKGTANWALWEQKTFLGMFTVAAQFLSIHRQHPVVGLFNEDIVREAQINYLNAEVQRLGGIDKALETIPDDFAEKAIAEFAVILAEHNQGIGDNEQAYSFTQDEMNIMKKNATLFFEKAETELIKKDLENLAAVGTADAGADLLLDIPLSNDLARIFEARMRKYVLSTTNDTISVSIDVPNAEALEGDPDTKSVTVELPVFTYSYEIRALAATLLRSGRSEAPEWGLSERMGIKDELMELTETALTVSIYDVDAKELPKNAARWTLENKELLETLNY